MEVIYCTVFESVTEKENSSHFGPAEVHKLTQVDSVTALLEQLQIISSCL